MLTTHQHFMDKQRTLAYKHRKRNLELPKTVSSKRATEGSSTGGLEEGSRSKV